MKQKSVADNLIRFQETCEQCQQKTLSNKQKQNFKILTNISTFYFFPECKK